MRLLAIIPARGGSKGIPRKNIRLLCGRPLIAYSISAAQEARSVERIIVSTDDEEIAEISQRLGAEVRLRPAELATDDAPTRPVLAHVVAELAKQSYVPDAVLTLQPTSPLRAARHIDDAAALFAADPSADSLVSCIEVPHIFHPLSVMRRNSEGYLEPFFSTPQPHRRQDKQRLSPATAPRSTSRAPSGSPNTCLAGDLSHILWTRKARWTLIRSKTSSPPSGCCWQGLEMQQRALLRRVRNRVSVERDLWSWARQLAPLRAAAPAAGVRTALFCNVMAMPATAKVELLIAGLLRLKGYRIIVLLDGPDIAVERIFRAAVSDATIIRLCDEIGDADELAAECAAESLMAKCPDLQSLVKLEVDGFRVGRNVQSIVLRHFRIGRLDDADPRHREATRKTLARSLAAKSFVERMFEDRRPDIAVFVERGYTPAGEIFDACLLHGVDTIQWCGAPQSDCLIYRRYSLSTRAEHPLALS